MGAARLGGGLMQQTWRLQGQLKLAQRLRRGRRERCSVGLARLRAELMQQGWRLGGQQMLPAGLMQAERGLKGQLMLAEWLHC